MTRTFCFWVQIRRPSHDCQKQFYTCHHIISHQLAVPMAEILTNPTLNTPEVPDFSYGTMDRELGVVTPTQNQKITWAVELFGDNEDLCFMYRYAGIYLSRLLYFLNDIHK